MPRFNLSTCKFLVLFNLSFCFPHPSPYIACAPVPNPATDIDKRLRKIHALGQAAGDVLTGAAEQGGNASGVQTWGRADAGLALCGGGGFSLIHSLLLLSGFSWQVR